MWKIIRILTSPLVFSIGVCGMLIGLFLLGVEIMYEFFESDGLGMFNCTEALHEICSIPSEITINYIKEGKLY